MRTLYGFIRENRSFDWIALVALSALMWGVVYLNYDLSQ
jgi:hypothetical protein